MESKLLKENTVPEQDFGKHYFLNILKDLNNTGYLKNTRLCVIHRILQYSP